MTPGDRLWIPQGATNGVAPFALLAKGQLYGPMTILKVASVVQSAAELSQITLEDVEEATVNHYHIRWSALKLDWEAFSTREEAETAAKQLMRPQENYSIEQFDGECPLCGAMVSRASSAQA